MEVQGLSFRLAPPQLPWPFGELISQWQISLCLPHFVTLPCKNLKHTHKKTNWAHLYRSKSGFWLLFHQLLGLCLPPALRSLLAAMLSQAIILGKVSPPTLILLYKMGLTILGPFPFQIHFRIRWSTFAQKLVGIPVGTALTWMSFKKGWLLLFF